MERNEIMEMLQNIIREAVDNEELVIRNATTAEEVDGWDSLAQVLIIGEIQNEFGVRFTSSEVSGLANVGELVDAINVKM